MFSFKEYLVEYAEGSCVKEEMSSSEKHHALAFGRMNPITSGHEAVVNKLHSVAKENGATHSLVVSHSQDAKKNPLTAEQKVKHAKNAFPGTNVTAASKESPTILHHAAAAHAAGATHLHVIAGSDRHEEMHNLLHKYNGKDSSHGHYNFKKITVHSSGERDPDAEGTTGISASKMREHAASGNKQAFHAGAPSKMKPEHKDAMYNDVRKGMNLKEAYTPAPVKKPRSPNGFNKQGTGLGNKLAELIRKERDEKEKPVKEHIEKVAGGYEVESEHGNKNLGKSKSLSAAKKRLKQVEYFKHMHEEHDDQYEMAQEFKKTAEQSKAAGNHGAYHAHMANHHDHVGQWHEKKGRSAAAEREYDKAAEHYEQSLKHPYISESFSSIEHNGNHKKITHGDAFGIKVGKEHHGKISSLEHGDRHIFKCMDGNEYGCWRNGENLHFKRHSHDGGIHSNMSVIIPVAQWNNQDAMGQDKPVKEETLDQQDDHAKQLKRFKDQMTKGNGPKIDTEIALDKKEKSAMGVKEHLDAKAGAGAWINDFISSTNPRFNNKSKEERRKMAIGAYMAAKAKGIKEEVELEEGYDKTSPHHKAAKQAAQGFDGKATYHPNGHAEVRMRAMVHGHSTVNPQGTTLMSGEDLAKRAAKEHGGKAEGNIVHFKEEVELEEGTFKYHMDKAVSAHMKGDSKKALYHLDNAKTARYAMPTKNYAKNKDLLNKYKEMSEEVQIDELSTDLLARYKTASHASAKTSDEAGNYAKGDKRFSGINKATRKQFDNDLKKHGQYVKEGRGLAAKYWSIAQDRKETAYENRGNHATYHTHMADHHDHMSRYHEELGQHSHAQAHADKADIHHEKSMQKPKAVKESAMNDVPNSDRTDRKGSAYNPFRKEKNASDIARINAAKEREKKSSGLYKKQSPSQRKQTVGELMKLVTHIGEGTMQDNGTDKIDTQTSAPTSSTSKNETPGKKVKGFKFFSGENQPNTQMTVKETATGNPHQGYHGAQQSADDKYEATHKHVKNLTDGDDKTVKHYLDSSHGRHLAGREDDHEYIKKDFKKFKKYYRPEMHEETLKPGSKVQNIDKKTAVIKLHLNGAASDTDEGWAKPKIKEGTMKSYMEFLQSLEEASKKKPEWLEDAEKNAEKKEGKLKEAKEGSAEDKKQDKAGMKRTGMTAKEWEKSAEDKKEDMQEANWIKGAIKHPGAMTAAAKRAGETNSEYEQQHKHDSGKAGRRARLALTLKKMHEEKLDEANHRDLACGGCMHPDMAKHMTVGQHADYYEKGTGDKVHGKVMHKSDTEVHMKQTQDSYDDKKVGTVHKFKIKHSLDEAQINEYESDKSGVYRHTKKATYGTSYVDPEGADETAADLKKKTAGRKAGKTTGSYKPRATMSKLKQLGATYK